jgi:hypothetical protein
MDLGHTVSIIATDLFCVVKVFVQHWTLSVSWPFQNFSLLLLFDNVNGELLGSGTLP